MSVENTKCQPNEAYLGDSKIAHTHIYTYTYTHTDLTLTDITADATGGRKIIYPFGHLLIAAQSLNPHDT